jgi:ABC-type transporter MlaC component
MFDRRSIQQVQAQSLFRAVGFLLLVVLFSPSRNAFAAYNESAFIDELGHQTMMTMASNDVASADRVQRLAVIVIHDFDVAMIARFVLGDQWARATEAERDDFTSSFRDYLMRRYSGSFAACDRNSFQITDQHAVSDTTSLVRTQMTQSTTGQPVKLDWLVAKTSYGFRVADIIVDGASLARTAQAAFAAAIARNGGEIMPLIQELKQADDLQHLWTDETLSLLRTRIAGFAGAL